MKITETSFRRLLFETDDAHTAVSDIAQIWTAHADQEKPRLGLSEPEHDVHLFLWYHGEVGNGGHAQFFMNPISEYTAELLDGLQRMQSTSDFAILSRASSAFPGGLPPRDWGERDAIIQGFPEVVFSTWNELDRELWNISNESFRTALLYLRENEAQIAIMERA